MTYNNLFTIFFTAGLLNNMFNSPMSRVQTEALPPLDLSSYQIATHCLQCLAHLFSWIPLSATITPALLSTIFHFAGFGCESAASFDAHQAASSPCEFSAVLYSDVQVYISTVLHQNLTALFHCWNVQEGQ